MKQLDIIYFSGFNEITCLISIRASLEVYFSLLNTGLALPATLFFLLVPAYGHLLPSAETARGLREEDLEEGLEAQTRIRDHRSVSSEDNHECLDGFRPGLNYRGTVNVTVSGRTCQRWSSLQPHFHKITDVGEHNYCRQPGTESFFGVWCFTTDPDKRWEYCSVPRCGPKSTSHDCQKAGFSPGRYYSGKVNVTASGRTCQNWAASEPHKPAYTDVGELGYTEVGDHNYCRNPSGNLNGVWCYTTDPGKRWEYCSVPFCASKPIKVLDFSADNDQKRDHPDNEWWGEYTSAFLDAGALPESFTICSAFMVEAWTTEFASARMFMLVDMEGDKAEGDPWVYIELSATSSFTEYRVGHGTDRTLGTQFVFSNQTKAVLFPLHWTRACLSLDSIARKVRVVVDGQLLGKEEGGGHKAS